MVVAVINTAHYVICAVEMKCVSMDNYSYVIYVKNLKVIVNYFNQTLMVLLFKYLILMKRLKK